MIKSELQHHFLVPRVKRAKPVLQGVINFPEDGEALSANFLVDTGSDLTIIKKLGVELLYTEGFCLTDADCFVRFGELHNLDKELMALPWKIEFEIDGENFAPPFGLIYSPAKIRSDSTSDECISQKGDSKALKEAKECWPHHILIGRDILCQTNFHYIGKNNKLTWQF